MKKEYLLYIGCLGLIVLACGCATVQSKEDILQEARQIKEEKALAQEQVPPNPIPEIVPLETTAIVEEEVPKPSPSPLPKTDDRIQVSDIGAEMFAPFQGEILTYSAKYLGITIGEMKAMVKGRTIYKDRPVIIFEATARSIPPFSKVFKVENSFVSYMDAEKFRVLYHKESRREGRYRKESSVDFDYKLKKAFFYNDIDKSRKEVDIPDKVHDILTANYFIRMSRWGIGDTLEFKIYASEKIYDFLAVVRSEKKVKLKKLGERRSFYIQPYAYIKGKKYKKGKIKAFFDFGRTRIPLKGQVSSPIFGSASFTLKKIGAK